MIAIYNILEQLSCDVPCALYKDDFTIFASERIEAHSSGGIQSIVSKLTEWTQLKGMKFKKQYYWNLKNTESVVSIINIAQQ